jgi:hypothetical protein
MAEPTEFFLLWRTTMGLCNFEWPIEYLGFFKAYLSSAYVGPRDFLVFVFPCIKMLLFDKVKEVGAFIWPPTDNLSTCFSKLFLLSCHRRAGWMLLLRSYWN